jgi:hypothetical protein
MSWVGRVFVLSTGLLVQVAVLPAQADQTSLASGARAQVVAKETKSDKANPPVIYGWNWDYTPWTYINDLREPMTPAPPVRPYTADVAWQHVQSSPLEVIGLSAAILYVGTKHWDWNTNTQFHFHSEGWFGKGTTAGGTDKLGHAFFSHVLSDFFTWRFYSRGFNMYESALTGALLSGLVMVAIEVGDGFSPFGASYEDLIFDAAGIAFSFISNTVPGVRERFDFRMQYIPTGHDNSSAVGDYSGKKFLLAAKLGGFDTFKDTSLRYLELHAGYFTQGYSSWELREHRPQSRHPYVGVGLNLSEILFSHPDVRDTSAALIGRRALQYFQVPYTYIATDYDNRGR